MGCGSSKDEDISNPKKKGNIKNRFYQYKLIKSKIFRFLIKILLGKKLEKLQMIIAS